jgi:hypothetical protein
MTPRPSLRWPADVFEWSPSTARRAEPLPGAGELARLVAGAERPPLPDRGLRGHRPRGEGGGPTA